MTRRVKVALSAAFLPVAVIVGLNTIFYRPFETPTQRAYRACAECSDLSPAEVDGLIITVRLAPGSRADKLRLFVDQFEDEGAAERCTPCTEAVLDAADAEVNQPGQRL